MKFTYNVARLKHALALLKLDEPETHLSITAQAAQLQLRCYTDDGNFCIDHAIPAEVESSGKATVPPATLSSVSVITRLMKHCTSVSTIGTGVWTLKAINIDMPCAHMRRNGRIPHLKS